MSATFRRALEKHLGELRSTLDLSDQKAVKEEIKAFQAAMEAASDKRIAKGLASAIKRLEGKLLDGVNLTDLKDRITILEKIHHTIQDHPAYKLRRKKRTKSKE